MAVYKVVLDEKELYTISSGHAWLPGVYESRRAALYAFRFANETLQRLQDAANAGGGRVITFADLQSAREARR